MLFQRVSASLQSAADAASMAFALLRKGDRCLGNRGGDASSIAKQVDI
jgi:hypothetical protein